MPGSDGNIQQSFPFPGVFLWENFVSEDEEKKLVAKMDQDIWRESQSGRRKQVLNAGGTNFYLFFSFSIWHFVICRVFTPITITSGPHCSTTEQTIQNTIKIPTLVLWNREMLYRYNIMCHR